MYWTGLFSINEPILFGAPMVCNPLFLLPMIINTVLGSVIVWCIFEFGLLAYPSVALPGVGTLPVVFGTVMLTGDFTEFYGGLFYLQFMLWCIIHSLK